MADAFINSSNPSNIHGGTVSDGTTTSGGNSASAGRLRPLAGTTNNGTRVILPGQEAQPGITAPITQVNPYIADVTRTDQARVGMIDLNPSRRSTLNLSGSNYGMADARQLGPLPEMYTYSGGSATGMLGFSQVMWAAVQTVDPLIQKKPMMAPRFWHDRIPRGQFQLHNGLVHQRRIFRGSIYKTVGLDDWEPIDPIPTLSNDPCRFPKHGSVDYAWDQLAWSGMRSAWGSDPICANAFRYIQDAAQQLALILEAGMEVGIIKQETFNRDMYVAQSTNFGRSFVMTSVMHGQASAPRYFYDPFVRFQSSNNGSFTGDAANKIAVKELVSDKKGKPHAFVVIDAREEIEPLNWYSLDRMHEMLKLRCPDAAVGSENGEPVFGLMVNTDDVVKSIEGDDKVYREWLEAKPQALIDNYKLTFRTYRNWGVISDPSQLRFKIVRYEATWDQTACTKYGGVGQELVGNAPNGVYIAIAVEPIVAEETRKGINGGDIPTENIEYVDAELAIAPVFMNNVFVNEFETQGQVNLKNGMTFGAFPALNGQWGWIRGPQTDADPFQQTGKFYGLFLLHPRPEARVYDTMSFIYRRCKESIRARCPVENPRVNPDAVKKGTDATVKTGYTVAAGVKLTLGSTFDITLEPGYGPLAIGDPRYLGDYKVVVVDVTSAPVITVAFLGDKDTPADVTGASTTGTAIIADNGTMTVEAPAAAAAGSGT